MRVPLPNPTYQLSATAGNVPFPQWKNCSFTYNAASQKIAVKPADNPNVDAVLFSDVEIYDDLNFALGKFMRNNNQFVRIIANNGRMSPIYDTLDNYIYSDSEKKYLAVHKLENQHYNRLYVVDLDDVSASKGIISCTRTPTAQAPIWEEVVDIRDGIAEIERSNGEYTFCAIADFPRQLINRYPSQYEYLCRWQYRLYYGRIYDDVNFTNEMKRFSPLPTIISGEEIYFKTIMIKKNGAPITNDRGMVIIKNQELRNITTLHEGDGLFVAGLGSNKVYLVRYFPMHKTVNPIREITLNAPLSGSSERHIFYTTAGDAETVRKTDIDTYLTTLVGKLPLNGNQTIFTSADLVSPTPIQEEPVAIPIRDLKYQPLSVVYIDSENLVQLYSYTKDIIDDNYYIDHLGNRVNIGLNPNLAEETIVYNRELTPQNGRKYRTDVSVVQGDSLEIAKQMIGCGVDPTTLSVHNMASRRAPGGRAETGARTQEACLYRCSDYSVSLDAHKDSYPLERNYGGIYSPGVTVFRDTEANGYALLEQPWQVNMIAVPAMHRPMDESETEGYVKGMKNKIRTIFNIAIEHGQTNLVLGAFGCGGLHNIPKQIANLFLQILCESRYCTAFETIKFAIYDDKDTIEAFTRILDRKSLAKATYVNDEDVIRNINSIRENALHAAYRRAHYNINDYVQEIENIDMQRIRIDDDFDKENLNLLLQTLDFSYRNQGIAPVNLSYLWRNIPDEDLDEIVSYFICDADEDDPLWVGLEELQDEGFEDNYIAIGYFKYMQEVVYQTQRNHEVQ